VKGVVDAEAVPAFNPLSWRYEPLAIDYPDFSPKGSDERGAQQFAPYRMEYDARHARGMALVDSEDVHPRAVFFLDVAKSTYIPDTGQFVTAYTIFAQNDSWQHWLAKLGDATVKAAIEADPATALGWSAQTTLASSYGLMQVLFDGSGCEGRIISSMSPQTLRQQAVLSLRERESW
jgi:hypothetical protein